MHIGLDGLLYRTTTSGYVLTSSWNLQQKVAQPIFSAVIFSLNSFKDIISE